MHVQGASISAPAVLLLTLQVAYTNLSLVHGKTIENILGTHDARSPFKQRTLKLSTRHAQHIYTFDTQPDQTETLAGPS